MMNNPPHRILGADFYGSPEVVDLARDLLGKILVTEIAGVRTTGIITETEAYRAPDDRASHAHGNRRTTRTEVMFRAGGCAYVYLCYGIHHLFNVVTGPEGMAHAILIRAVEPLDGLDTMLQRRGIPPGIRLTTGPGAMSQALGIDLRWNGADLTAPDAPVHIEMPETESVERRIASGKRIGVDYAGECAAWPWRFWLEHSRYHK